MTFKAIIKDIPLWEAKTFKGVICKYDLVFSKEIAWYIGREFEFEEVLELDGDKNVEIKDWFRAVPDGNNQQIEPYYFHKSWLDMQGE